MEDYAPMAGGTGTLLERDGLLSTLRQLLGDVRSNAAGRIVLLGGEAGVGKTALLRQFCDEVTGSARILWGGCEPLRTPRPLGPFADIAQPGGELLELISGRPRPHEVAMALLSDLRGRLPAVLVLEDVHWADEATLDVLTLLAGRVTTARALVVASYRDDQLDRADQLRFVLGELVRGPGRLTVPPLSLAAVTELAGPHGVDPTELFRRTAGNPFFVIEALAAGGEEIPSTVRDAVLARAGRLSGPARTLLDTIAVVPGQLDLRLLEDTAGDQLDHLDECLASGMLSAGRHHIAFRHELARLAIEEAIAPHRRLELHRAVLAALSERGPDYPRLSHHAEAAGDSDAVLRWAPRAGEQAAASGAHRDAAAQFERALRFAAGSPPELRAALLERRAAECYLTAEIDAAVAAQREALACRERTGDELAAGDATRALSRLLFFAGQTDEGERLAAAAVQRLERLPPGHELAMAYANVSQRRMVVEDNAAAIEWGERALALARQLGDDDVCVYALINMGAAEYQAGADAGREKLEQAIALATGQDRDEHAARALMLLSRFAITHRAFTPALAEWLDTGSAYCVDRGLDTWRLYLLALRARTELALGRWGPAADAAAAVLRDPRSAPVATSWALGALGAIRARRGDPHVWQLLDRMQALVQRTGEVERIGQAAAARAEAAWLSRDPARVGEVSEAALALALDRGVPWVAGELAYWRAEAGIDDRLPGGVLAEPYAAAIAGDWDRARALWTAIGCPYEAALAAARGTDPVAIRDAVNRLQSLGARPAAAIVSRGLRERGVRSLPRGPRARTRENPGGLTPREVEVVQLLAQGLRNAQIAERLVVSEKTVDHHVSSILRKLDAETRGEASAEAARLGLLAGR